MATTNQAGSFHKQAAIDHQLAAIRHLKAADSHDNNQHIAAKKEALTAMDFSEIAHKSTQTAFNNSVINSKTDLQSNQS